MANMARLKRINWQALKRKLTLPVLFFILLFAGIGAKLSIDLVRYSESPQFCALCHSMKDQHQAWTYSAHRQAKCIDCHLPNDNLANHFVWKGIDGIKDVVSEFAGLKEDQEIKLSKHGEKVLQSNCLRCHEHMASLINNTRSCTDCHKASGHKITAAVYVENTEVK